MKKTEDLERFRKFASNWAIALQRVQAEDCATLATLMAARETDERVKMGMLECARVIREKFCGEESSGND